MHELLYNRARDSAKSNILSAYPARLLAFSSREQTHMRDCLVSPTYEVRYLQVNLSRENHSKNIHLENQLACP